MLEPIRGINAENYFAMGKAFIGAQEKGFVIIRDQAWATHEFGHTPREWGAWMSYFRSRRIKAVVFEKQGKGTVPARWPHLFDADWHPDNDEQAADMFETTLAGETRDAERALSAEGRKAAVTNRLGYDPAKRRGVYEPEVLIEKPLQFIDKDLLFACHAEDMAAHEARKKKALDDLYPQPVDTRVSSSQAAA